MKGRRCRASSVAAVTLLFVGAAPAAGQNADRHHALAGFGAGASLAGAVFALDAVQGSSCIGSGPYLRNCRAVFLAAEALGGGVGALIGSRIRTPGAPTRANRLAVGSVVGANAAFLASLAACSQEDDANPDLLCGYDGMVSTHAVVSGAVLGALLGEVIGRAARMERGPGITVGPGGMLVVTFGVGGGPLERRAPPPHVGRTP